VTRYVVVADGRWVTALHAANGAITFTDQKEDASSWVTYECAVKAAKIVMERLGQSAFIHSVEEPVYPKSWL